MQWSGRCEPSKGPTTREKGRVRARAQNSKRGDDALRDRALSEGVARPGLQQNILFLSVWKLNSMVRVVDLGPVLGDH